jgi:sugar (glycoside-pentoside-hexuronide) transporter
MNDATMNQGQIMDKSSETNVVFSFGKRFTYGLGDFGNNFNWTFVSSFLMFFYTDVFGIKAGTVAILILVSRIWDAINDPMIGALTDRTKSRWGRYRPWELFATPAVAILLVLTDWARPDLSENSKIVYMYVTYGLLVFAYTCVNIPYGTLCSVMTQNIVERGKLSTFRLTMALFAIQLINAIANPLVQKLGGGNRQTGFLYTAILFGCIFILCHIICFCNTKELVSPPKKQKISLGLQLKSAIKNPPFILAIIAQTIWGFNVYGRGAVGMYYFRYVENNVILYSYVSLVGLSTVLGAALFPLYYKKLGNKGRVSSLLAFLVGIALFILHFFRASENPVVFYFVAAIVSFFSGTFTVSVYAIVPDCAEYGEWKTGLRNDGFLYAFVSLGNKVGMAFGSAGIAAALGALGYVANQDQSPQIRNIIGHFYTTIPAILWIATAVLMLFYKIDKNSFNQMVSEIKTRTSVD